MMREEIEIGKGERREVLLLNPSSAEYSFVQGQGSVLCVHVFCLDDRDAEVKIEVEQQGDDCTTRIYGLAVNRGSQQNALRTAVKHRGNGGVSRQLIKFILADQSRGDFEGELEIVKDVKGNDAQQGNRNLLLSDKAKMRTQPQLLIYADDVKASHGASTGQLDQSSVFYMQQRGISKESAMQLLIGAFAEEVAQTIEDEKKRKEIEAKIGDRLKELVY